MSVVTASQFTPLKGHVQDGTVVRFDDGTLLTVKGTMSGWSLVGLSGQEWAQTGFDAVALSLQVVRLQGLLVAGAVKGVS